MVPGIPFPVIDIHIDIELIIVNTMLTILNTNSMNINQYSNIESIRECVVLREGPGGPMDLYTLS